MKYDYLIARSRLFDSIFACKINQEGEKYLMIDKRRNINVNTNTEGIDGTHVHKYRTHISHTSNRKVWDCIQQFDVYNRYINRLITDCNNEIYDVPFNKLWVVVSPKKVKGKVEQIRVSEITGFKKLVRQSIYMVGKDIDDKLVKGYTRKQWGRPCTELPSFMIKRLPIRLTYDKNYLYSTYQRILVEGHTQIIEKMLASIDMKINTDFFEHRDELRAMTEKIVFTGMIDQYYRYQYGTLEFRSLRFKEKIIETDNYQGNIVVNGTEYEIPYTRIIEHKKFEYRIQERTNITREYPVNNEKSNALYEKYKELESRENKVIFSGRLGMYKYFDMLHFIEEALKCVDIEIGD